MSPDNVHTDRADRHFKPLVLLLVILPLFIAAFRLPFRLSNFYPQGDMAVLEIGTLHASTGAQLLGPYSRFHWNHPGPLYFYLLVPFYVLSGRQSWSLVLSAILINAASITLILRMVLKRGGPIMFHWTALLLAFYFTFLGKKFLSPWNPDITLLPLAALFTLAAAACVGSFPSFLMGLLVGSFIVQTHIGYFPVVVVLLGISFITQTTFIFRSRNDFRMKMILKRTGVAILLLVILWMPAIWEQTQRNPGNISRIIEFFSQRAANHSFAEAFLAVTSVMVPPFEMGTNFSFLIFVPIALVLLTTFVFLSCLRKNWRFSAALCMLALTADPVMVLSAKRIVGGITPYLIHWTFIVALVNWIPVGAFAWQKFAQSRYYVLYSRAGFFRTKWIRKSAYYLIILGFTLQNCWAMSDVSLVRHEDVRIEPLFQDLKSYLESNEIRKPLLLIADRNEWGIGAGIILQLYKARHPFAIQGWPTLFGEQFERAGDEDAYLWLFHGAELHRVLKKQIVNHLIARERNFFIYEVPFSRLENSGLDKPAPPAGPKPPQN